MGDMTVRHGGTGSARESEQNEREAAQAQRQNGRTESSSAVAQPTRQNRQTASRGIHTTGKTTEGSTGK